MFKEVKEYFFLSAFFGKLDRKHICFASGPKSCGTYDNEGEKSAMNIIYKLSASQYINGIQILSVILNINNMLVLFVCEKACHWYASRIIN